MTAALVPLAEGAEEMETVIIVDTLRRAGWKVVLASLGAGPTPVTCSRRVRIVPDTTWSAIEPAAFDLLVLPGGTQGTDALRSHPGVLAAVREFVESGKWVGAICAAPLALQAAGVLQGRRATCHPAVRDLLRVDPTDDSPVVVDGSLITSRGPGTAFAFALTLICLLDGQAAADDVRKGLVL